MLSRQFPGSLDNSPCFWPMCMPYQLILTFLCFYFTLCFYLFSLQGWSGHLSELEVIFAPDTINRKRALNISAIHVFNKYLLAINNCQTVFQVVGKTKSLSSRILVSNILVNKSILWHEEK